MPGVIAGLKKRIMKEPYDYKKFTPEQKALFTIASFMGFDVVEVGVKEGWNHNRFCSNWPDGTTMMHQSVGIKKDEVYSKQVQHLINDKFGNAGAYLKSWDKLIPALKKLRANPEHKAAFTNQLSQIDYWLIKYFDIESTVKYVVGAINVLNGKRGAYPI